MHVFHGPYLHRKVSNEGFLFEVKTLFIQYPSTHGLRVWVVVQEMLGVSWSRRRKLWMDSMAKRGV